MTSLISALVLANLQMPEERLGGSQPQIEDILRKFQASNDVPGLCFTLSWKDKLFYSYSRGWADRESKTAFTLKTKCALASISKVPTAFAMIALLEKRGISLDESAMKYLKVSDAIAREQIRNGEYPHITFRHLLQHSAGFGTSFDPWSRQEVATAFKSKMPTTAKENLEYGLRRPLLQRPGEKFDYSNFGYLLLGRLIEDLSGSSYSDYVQQTVFKPLGVGGWLIRSSRKETQHPNECVYYEEPANLYTSRFPQDGNKKVPNMYGGEAFEEAAAFGGWVSNSEALASFASAIGNSRIRRVISAKGLSEIVARPSYAGTDGHYKGLGLDIEAPFGTSHLAFRHGGVLYGASSWFSSNFAGVTMTLVLNKGVVGKSLGWECHQDLMNAICAKDWSSEVRGGRPLGLPQK